MYDDFVAQMHAGGLLELLDQYPVLARLLCQGILQWVDATAEFCNRVRADAATLDPTGTLDWAESIEAVQSGLSDRHHDGRTVVRFTFRGGRQFIYKPRGLFGETVFYDLLALLNGSEGMDEVKIPHVLDRGLYGWMEFVSSKACNTADELHGYYRRMGIILCASFLLSATDLHYENIVAVGEHPVAVDLEMLFCGRSRASQEREMPATDLPTLLQIGMLPLGSWSQESERDLSALGDRIEYEAAVPALCWARANCDQMIATERKPDVQYGRHRPQLNGTLVKASDYAEDIVEGFERTYNLILRRKEEISHLLAHANGEPVSGLRVIIRDSSTYANMLEHLLKPVFLRDGLDRSIELEWLARPLSGPYQVRAGRRKIYDSELAAMERLDIPHFTVAQWEAFQLGEDEDFFRYHQLRGNSVALGRLAWMDERNREDQMAIIRKVLAV
jgi:type 2 lantibiotic biosynthesis protein LanM